MKRATLNTTELRLGASSRGKLHEIKAAQFLQSLGWKILKENIEIAGVQLDLLAKDTAGLLHIVEVKSGGSLARGVLGKAQKSRLQRALGVLAHEELVALSVVVVEGANFWFFEAIDL